MADSSLTPSNGFLSRMFRKKGRTSDIELPNPSGKVDPRIERNKKRMGFGAPDSTVDKVHEGLEGYSAMVKRIRNKK